MSKAYLCSSNLLKHTYFKIKIVFFNTWLFGFFFNTSNFHDFFEVLELKILSQFYLVCEYNQWFHTELYSVTHNLTLIYKLQTFLYKFKIKNILIPKSKPG